mgnify:CR=1 FL=1
MSIQNSYSESSITVLKGLEPVKERPGMYTRTESPTHICQEVIDNAADEALGGFADEISVSIHDDGSLSVRDNGRGIPVGLHPLEQVPVVGSPACMPAANSIKKTAALMLFQAGCTAWACR